MTQADAAVSGGPGNGDIIPFDFLPGVRLTDPDFLAQLRRKYLSAVPYPHVCIDALFDEGILRKVANNFPDLARLSVQHNNQREIKRGSGHDFEIPPFTRAFIHALNSGPFIDFLEAMTGIEGLIPDPHLVGGGLHVLPRGGKLSLHTDFNYHERLKLHRRVNVLIYLNENWRSEYGGEFEAWRPNGREAEARYLPLFNRMVIFNTNDHTFHGNPEPVSCPEGWSRKSIALYYYTNGRPADEWYGVTEGTFFMNRPGERVAERKSYLRKRLLRCLPKFIRVAISAARRGAVKD
jgi:hypothetical protein